MMAGEQRRADLTLQLLNPLGDAVAGHVQPVCRGAETAATRHLKKNPDALPVRARATACYARVLKFVSTVSRL